MGGWVYMVTNKPHGMLYIGVTADLARRAWEHRTGAVKGFTKRYGLRRLVYAEPYEDVLDAIAREKQLKEWRRDWKIELIESQNPEWRNLYDDLSGL
jgi:putative endonuclease